MVAVDFSAIVVHTTIGVRGTVGEMLLISFLGEEPKNMFKLVYVDILTILLQIMCIQSKLGTEYRTLSIWPVSGSVQPPTPDFRVV